MPEGIKETVVTKVLESVPVLLIILGALFVIIGIAGGIAYQNWLPIPNAIPRLASGSFGILLIIVGIVRSRASNPGLIQPFDYGIKIIYPAAGSRVATVDVIGSIDKALPTGYCLRVFRVYPGSNSFVPLAKARIEISKKQWTAERCNIGGSQGDERAFAAYLCGVNAEALIDFHNQAASVHRTTMGQLEKATGIKADYLPAVSQRTEDMFECDRVSLIHS